LQASNLSLADGFTATAPHLHDEVSEAAVEAVAHFDEPALMATAMKGLPSLAALPMAKLDAARVLARALTTVLASESEGDSKQGPSISLRDEVQRFEANLIRSALAHTGGRQRRAARLLGMNVSTLNSRIKRYGISRQ
jgi:transcriptional regulator with GAF, ATPase, and Fis domain